MMMAPSRPQAVGMAARDREGTARPVPRRGWGGVGEEQSGLSRAAGAKEYQARKQARALAMATFPPPGHPGPAAAPSCRRPPPHPTPQSPQPCMPGSGCPTSGHLSVGDVHKEEEQPHSHTHHCERVGQWQGVAGAEWAVAWVHVLAKARAGQWGFKGRRRQRVCVPQDMARTPPSATSTHPPAHAAQHSTQARARERNCFHVNTLHACTCLQQAPGRAAPASAPPAVPGRAWCTLRRRRVARPPTAARPRPSAAAARALCR